MSTPCNHIALPIVCPNENTNKIIEHENDRTIASRNELHFLLNGNAQQLAKLKGPSQAEMSAAVDKNLKNAKSGKAATGKRVAAAKG